MTEPAIGSNRLPEIAALIKVADAEVRRSAEQMADCAIEAGKLLIEAKEHIGHGQWLSWLRDHAGVSERTAQRYMSLARAGIKSDTVADLGITGSLNLVADIAAIPVPDEGEYVVGLQDDNNSTFWLWPDKRDAQFVYVLTIIDGGDCGYSLATTKPVNREFIRRYLLLGDFSAFQFGNADFAVGLENDLPEHVTDWLDKQRRKIAPTWFERREAAR
jgi:hypothetical protein